MGGTFDSILPMMSAQPRMFSSMQYPKIRTKSFMHPSVVCTLFLIYVLLHTHQHRTILYQHIWAQDPSYTHARICLRAGIKQGSCLVEIWAHCTLTCMVYHTRPSWCPHQGRPSNSNKYDQCSIPSS